MATLDPFEPIREGLKDVRDAYKTRRTLELEEDKAKSESEEKRLKREKEKLKEEARAKLGEHLRSDPGNIFADPEGARLALEAGAPISTFRRQIDKSGITYPGGDVGDETTSPIRENLGGVPSEPQSEDYSFNKGASLQNLKNVLGRITDNIGSTVSQLPKTTSDKRGIDAQLQAQQAQAKALNRAISNYEKLNENLDEALGVFKGDDGKAAFNTAMQKYSKDIIPILEAAGIPAEGVQQQKENAVIDFANNWKLDKNAVNSLFNTYMERAAIADENFNDPATQEVLRYGKDMDVDTLKKVIQDDRLEPFHKNLLGNILRVKYFQDQASRFLQDTTGAVKEFVPITDEQIDELYKAVNVPIRTEAMNPAESIRSKAQDLKTEEDKDLEKKREKVRGKSKKSYKE